MLPVLSLLAATLASTSSQCAPLSDHSTKALNLEQRLAQGSWTGNFLQRDWTFTFDNESDKLSGRYIRSDGKNWYPLNDLSVSGCTISFSIESKPNVSFLLDFDASDQMSGTVNIDGLATVPFLATRSR